MRVLKAKKFVSGSSSQNQMITVLLTEVMKKNRNLQHLDLSSTNLPSQVIIFLCERLRKSRSILSVHFTDNPGLEEPNLEQTIHQMLKCQVRDPSIKNRKINVHRVFDFAMNSKMMERLQKSLSNERVEDGHMSLARDTIKIRQIMQ